jgi:hypothetical protein
MFEKIGNAAERLATNVSESRRGFMVRVGQAALGVAGVVGGLLALSAEAQAATYGYCSVQYALHAWRFTGYCACPRPGSAFCTSSRDTVHCPAGRITQRTGNCGGVLQINQFAGCTCR